MQTIRLKSISAPKMNSWLKEHGFDRGSYHTGFSGLELLEDDGIQFYPVITFTDSIALEGADLTEFILKFGI